MKHNKHTPILGIFLAIGLFLAFAIGCRSSVAPSHKTAIFTHPVDFSQYNKAYADASDNSTRLKIARAAALDASLTPNVRLAWLCTWRDLAFAEGAASMDLLQELAAHPASSETDGNLFRAFCDLAPDKTPNN